MASFIHKITLTDSEETMLKAALRLMIKHCQEKLDKGAGAPYWAHKNSAQDVLDRLNNNMNINNWSYLSAKIINQTLTGYAAYYKNHFEQDLIDFARQIPVDGNPHYDRYEFYIQYFYLTPQYKYLNIIPKKRQGLFAVALYWTVLVDQTFYTYFKEFYRFFRKKGLHPKFIGNCTAPSKVSSECGHHQHPRKIFHAINDTFDKGNRDGFYREIFENDQSSELRSKIEYEPYLQEAIQIMKEDLKHYFINQQFGVSWTDFWSKCEQEL